MRRTGKLHILTLASASFGIVSSVSVYLWDFNTPKFHLWLDLVPCGLAIGGLAVSLNTVSL
jgi:hypothetical protein